LDLLQQSSAPLISSALISPITQVAVEATKVAEALIEEADEQTQFGKSPSRHQLSPKIPSEELTPESIKAKFCSLYCHQPPPFEPTAYNFYKQQAIQS